MIQAAPTFHQIRAQVAAIRKKIPDAQTVAILSKGRWTGPNRVEDGEETYEIYQCDSPLAMRLALRDPLTLTLSPAKPGEREQEDEGVLAASAKLGGREGEAGKHRLAGRPPTTKVLITGLDPLEIDDDILVRLKPRKLVPLDPWQIVKSLFQARTIDPRLIRHPWIAERLMEQIPNDGFSPVGSGFLDAETVWPILLERSIGLNVASPDLIALLKWSTDADRVRRFRETDETFRQAAVDWLAGLAGPAAGEVLRCVEIGSGTDAVAIGLASSIVLDPRGAGKLDRAMGKLEERYFGGQLPPSTIIAAWHSAAKEVVRSGMASHANRADEVLREVGAESSAWLSDTSPLGFDQRLSAFGQRLADVVSLESATLEKQGQDVEARLSVLRDAYRLVLEHDQRHREPRRIERVEMAMRLVRWLATGGERAAPGSLGEAATDYLHDGGYVDWARLALRSGEEGRELSEAYGELLSRVAATQQRLAESFAGMLVDWSATKTSDERLVPVEQVLDRVVAPLASHGPLLAIVLDGMSVAVFRELMADIVGRDWILLAENGVGLRPGLATIPSVTEASRTSLLCGRCVRGDQSTERSGFANHPGLLTHCRSGFPPVLFHKALLQGPDDVSLHVEVRKEIASAHRKVVGVVVNAIDDQLDKGQQINVRWTRDDIAVLSPLLHEARLARRTVVLLSDHGHVLDFNSRKVAPLGTSEDSDGGAGGAVGVASSDQGGERWRADGGEPQAGEMSIQGPRVLMPSTRRLIAPWNEQIRYVGKKKGYHGGIAPQEMVVPIGVLTTRDEYPAGWTEAPADTPAWWDAPLVDHPEPPPEVKHTEPAESPREGLLFDLESEPTPESAATDDTERDRGGEPASGRKRDSGGKRTSGDEKASESATELAADTSEWIRAFLASPVFDQQKKIAGRAVPSDQGFAQLLRALDARGGKMTTTALASAINTPPMRLRGILAVAGRVLNVDGYAVLTRDDASNTVELDRDLLVRQFDLQQAGKPK